MRARDDSEAVAFALGNSPLFTENPESIWLQRERWNHGSAADGAPRPTLLPQEKTETLTEDREADSRPGGDILV